MNYTLDYRHGIPGFIGADNEFHVFDHETITPLVAGRIVNLPGINWKGLDRPDQLMLKKIAGESNLSKLVHDETPPLTMAHYLFFLNTRLIRREGEQVMLTDTAAGWVKRFALSIPTSETGDEVTIISLRPNMGRLADTRGHWIGRTKAEDKYTVNLFIEDWRKIQAAGYKLPDWNDRPVSDIEDVGGFEAKAKGKDKQSAPPSFPCNISVVLYREPHPVSGWRMAEVKPPERDTRAPKIGAPDLTPGMVVRTVRNWREYRLKIVTPPAYTGGIANSSYECEVVDLDTQQELKWVFGLAGVEVERAG